MSSIGLRELIAIITHPRQLILVLQERAPNKTGETQFALLIMHEPDTREHEFFLGEVGTKAEILQYLNTQLEEGLKKFHEKLRRPTSLESRTLSAPPTIPIENILTPQLIDRIITDLYSENVADTYTYEHDA